MLSVGSRAALCALGSIAAAMLGPPVAHAQQFEIPASAKAAIIDATNTYRQSKGLATLSESEDASREGQAYANYLAEKTKGGQSAGGRDPVQRLRAGGVKVLQVPRGQLARVVDEACARLSRRCDGCSHALLEEIAGT